MEDLNETILYFFSGGSQDVCHLSRGKRYAAVGQKGVTMWMTGLSGSGKSTIAKAVEDVLVKEYGKHVYRLDGDNIRTGLNRVSQATHCAGYIVVP